MSIHLPQLQHPKGMLTTQDISCITDNMFFCLTCIKCPSIVYIGETGRRLSDPFREHRRGVINGKNDLPLLAFLNQANHYHTLKDMKVAVLKAGLTNQDYCKKQEKCFISDVELCGSVGINQDFSFSWITHFFAYSRRRALPRPARALAIVCNRARELIQIYFAFSDWLRSPGKFFITNWHLTYLEDANNIPSIRWYELWYTIDQPRFQGRQPSCLFLSELKKKMAFTTIRRRNSWISN